ncbi:MAG TPA: serine/threonine protein kinase [Roseiflexaceae bacterium]|nr:serine/threonine protein kinase [Roseiflexaceae bacterium]
MSQATPAIPTIQGRYRIEAKLGIGRLAVVYRAYDERLQRQVLVHLLRNELLAQEPLRRRFVEEAHASARRSHQSLLEVYDSGEVAGRPFMITEYVHGRSIRELGALTPEDALLYFRQVVGAVAACQAAGVPHPPISSNNLIVVDDGHVELLESWLTPAAEVAADLAAYRSPERTAGQPMTYASVVYALGLLLYEMLTGKRAVAGSDPRELAQAHLTLTLPPLSDVLPGLYAPLLEQLVRQATAREPAQRPPDAAALSLRLDEVWRTINSETHRLPAPPVARPKLRERINRTAGAIMPRRRPPAPPPAPMPDDPEEQPGGVYSRAEAAERRPANRMADQREALRESNRRHAVTGLAILVSLVTAFCIGGYILASSAPQSIGAVQLPRFELGWPDLSISWPDWLTGVASGSGEVLVVTVEGLNLREQPGLNTRVLGNLSNNAQVRKLEGPQVVDNVPWLRIRARIGDRDVEGWASQNFLRSQTP